MSKSVIHNDINNNNLITNNISSTYLNVLNNSSTNLNVINNSSTNLNVLNNSSTNLYTLNNSSTNLNVLNNSSTNLYTLNNSSTNLNVLNISSTNLYTNNLITYNTVAYNTLQADAIDATSIYMNNYSTLEVIGNPSNPRPLPSNPAIVFGNSTPNGGSFPNHCVQYVGPNTSGIVHDTNGVSLKIYNYYPITGIEFDNNQTNGLYACTFYNSNGMQGNIITNPSSVSYNTSSDENLKENIIMANPLTSIETIKKINIRNYNFKYDPKTTHIGFIAQELASVIPNAVTIPDGITITGVAGIDYSKTIPDIINCLQYIITQLKL